MKEKTADKKIYFKCPKCKETVERSKDNLLEEEEKKKIELDIEAKYVGKTEKEFLSRLTYAECLYILTPENEYCDEVIKLSVLKICGIIEKYKKQMEELNIRLQEEINEKCKLKTELYLNSIPKSNIIAKKYDIKKLRAIKF